MFKLVLWKHKPIQWSIVREDDVKDGSTGVLVKWGMKWYRATILKESGKFYLCSQMLNDVTRYFVPIPVPRPTYGLFALQNRDRQILLKAPGGLKLGQCLSGWEIILVGWGFLAQVLS